jgi:hypothetical protein
MLAVRSVMVKSPIRLLRYWEHSARASDGLGKLFSAGPQ